MFRFRVKMGPLIGRYLRSEVGLPPVLPQMTKVEGQVDGAQQLQPKISLILFMVNNRGVYS